jgi:hypothetical protein
LIILPCVIAARPRAAAPRAPGGQSAARG